jgi:esterase
MSALMGFPTDDEPPPYEGPTLFIKGSRSAYVGPQHRAAIERWFPRAELTTIAEAGHWMHAERPAEFLEVVRHFLD